MQHHPIASLTRTTALTGCVAALTLALAGSAVAKPASEPQQLSENTSQQAQPVVQPQQLSERGGEQAQPAVVTNPQVGDTPSDRVSPTAAAPAEPRTTSTDDGDDNAPLIIGASLLTVALLGSGMYVVRRRRHLAPGH
jgi:hypothetical protein